jgi:hypothetical protein
LRKKKISNTTTIYLLQKKISKLRKIEAEKKNPKTVAEKQSRGKL